MSDKNKAFLTETSNLQDGKSASNQNEDDPNDDDATNKKIKSANSFLSRGEESLNSEDNQEEEEDEGEYEEDEYDDEDDDLNENEQYKNPFTQYLPLVSQNDENNYLGNKQNSIDKDENRSISPLAPKVHQLDELQVEISSTPAFQCLEELFQNGKLTGTQVAQLKAKYTELHLTLKKYLLDLIIFLSLNKI
jgi:hypothetical protein